MVIKDVWLSKVLGVSSFKIVEPSLNISKDDLKHKDFIYVKLQTDHSALINHFLRLNFSIIETNIILKSTKINFCENNKEIECRFAIKDDEEEIKKIAAESFQNSRFHIDNRIPNKKAKNADATLYVIYRPFVHCIDIESAIKLKVNIINTSKQMSDFFKYMVNVVVISLIAPIKYTK